MNETTAVEPLGDEEFGQLTESLAEAFVLRFLATASAKHWAGWIAEHSGIRYECQVRPVDGQPTVEKIREMQAEIASLHQQVADLLAQNEKVLSEYGAQDTLAECREMLHEAGFGKPGTSNTLLGMVKAACERIAECNGQPYLSDPKKQGHRFQIEHAAELMMRVCCAADKPDVYQALDAIANLKALALDDKAARALAIKLHDYEGTTCGEPDECTWLADAEKIIREFIAERKAAQS